MIINKISVKKKPHFVSEARTLRQYDEVNLLLAMPFALWAQTDQKYNFFAIYTKAHLKYNENTSLMLHNGTYKY